MNKINLSAPNVRRNNSCNLNRIIDRLEQDPLGGFDLIDDALISVMEPQIGEGFGRPVAERRAGR